eukprot:g7792.t1
MGRLGVREIRFSGPRPEILLGPGGGGPSTSHLRAWQSFKKTRGVGLDGEITIADFRTFAAFLLAVETPRGTGFASTAQYVDSAVAHEAEQGRIRSVLFQRQLASLKRSIVRHLRNEQKIPAQAPPIFVSALQQLTRRQQVTILIACSLGLRGDTLVAVERSHVHIYLAKQVKRGADAVVRKVAIDVRKDKSCMLRRVEVRCSCGSGAARCALCEISLEEWILAFPVSMQELVATCRAAGSGLHGPRRTCALGSMRVYDLAETESARGEILREVNRRQGWSDDARAPSFFRYGQDVATFLGQELLTVWLPSGAGL